MEKAFYDKVFTAAKEEALFEQVTGFILDTMNTKGLSEKQKFHEIELIVNVAIEHLNSR